MPSIHLDENYISLNCYLPSKLQLFYASTTHVRGGIHLALLQFTLAHIVCLLTTTHQAIRKRNNSKEETTRDKNCVQVQGQGQFIGLNRQAEKKKHNKERNINEYKI